MTRRLPSPEVLSGLTEAANSDLILVRGQETAKGIGLVELLRVGTPFE